MQRDVLSHSSSFESKETSKRLLGNLIFQFSCIRWACCLNQLYNKGYIMHKFIKLMNIEGLKVINFLYN